jgi:predicted O-methyltransferase YrrM
MSADPLRWLLRRPWRDVTLPPDAVGIPTMLSKTERKLLYGLARDYARGDAAIVDGGSFLGGSTAALLAGVRDRAQPWAGPPVASYDLFRVEAYTLKKFFPEATVGDSFRPQYDHHLARFDGPLDVYEGDITEIGWSGEPIDVLFLDVLKSPEITDAVLRDFFPSLVPGRSVIVHQDYAAHYTPWVPVFVELMRDSLTLVDWMEWGSHVFLLDRDVPAGISVASLDIDTRFELLGQAINRADGWVRGMLELSRTALVVERDGADAGVADAEAVAARFKPYRNVGEAAAEVRQNLVGQRSWLKRLTA